MNLKTLASFAQSRLLDAFAYEDRLYKDDWISLGYHLYVIKYAAMPAILTEASNINNEVEEANFLYNVDNHIETEASALYYAIADYFLWTPVEDPFPPAPPYLLPPEVVNNSIKLSWNPVENAQGYYIYRSTTSGSGYSLIGSTIYFSFTDSNIEQGVRYYYVAQAYNGYGNSGNSNEVSGGIPIPLSVTIDGPEQLGYKESGTFTAIVSGGSGSYSYSWFKNGSYYAWGNPIQAGDWNDFSLEVQVDDNQIFATGSATIYVQVGFEKKIFAETGIEPPKTYDLAQNYPNPFNPLTEISYQVPKLTYVSLKIYNLMGQEIRTLVEGEKATGYYTALWDAKDNSGNDVASGVYIYRMVAGDYSQIRKMILIR